MKPTPKQLKILKWLGEIPEEWLCVHRMANRPNMTLVAGLIEVKELSSIGLVLINGTDTKITQAGIDYLKELDNQEDGK